MIKIESGKFYKTRDGSKASADDFTRSTCRVIIDGFVMGRVFIANGLSNPDLPRTRPYDLIEEWKEEEKKMFEVGKRYIKNDMIIEVLNATEKTAHIRIIKSNNMKTLLREDIGLEHCYKQVIYSSGHWKEYTEPKVIVSEELIRTNGKEIWATPEALSETLSKTVGKIRISYIEGQGITVEVLEGGDTTQI